MPVGLFGLARKTILVFFVTAARIASTSAVKSVSGTTTGLRARAERHDRIDQKAVRGVDRLVAVGEIGVRQQVQQIIRARAADDALGIEPECPPDRLAQLARRAVRIILEMMRPTHCRPRSRAGSARAASRSTTA